MQPTHDRARFTHLLLAEPLSRGLLARRLQVNDTLMVATNVPPVRHFAADGFALGDASPGAADLSLAFVQVILDRLGYVGPRQRTEDGGSISALAHHLYPSFLAGFVATAQGDDLFVSWQKALAWARRELLAYLTSHQITLGATVERLRHQVDRLPPTLPGGPLDRQDFMLELHQELAILLGQVSILDQFLGMPG